MTLPFTADQFFGVFGAYNRALWPFVIILWASTVAAAIRLAHHDVAGHFMSALLTMH